MRLDAKKLQEMRDNELQIEAGGAVPVVKGVVFTNAIKYEVTPYKVRIFLGLYGNESVEEFDIKDVIFSGWPAALSPRVSTQED